MIRTCLLIAVTICMVFPGLCQTSKVRSIPFSHKIDLSNPGSIKKDVAEVKAMGKAEKKKYKAALKENTKQLKLKDKHLDQKMDSLFEARKVKRLAELKKKAAEGKQLVEEEADKRLADDQRYEKGKKALAEGKEKATEAKAAYSKARKRQKKVKKEYADAKSQAEVIKKHKHGTDSLAAIDGGSLLDSTAQTHKEAVKGMMTDSIAVLKAEQLDKKNVYRDSLLSAAGGEQLKAYEEMLPLDSSGFQNLDSLAKDRITTEAEAYAQKQLNKNAPGLESNLPQEQAPTIDNAFSSEEYGLSPGEMNDMMKNMQDIQSFKIDQEKIDEAKKKYVNHFAGKEKLLAAAQKKVSATKKVSKFKRFLEDLVDQDTASHKVLNGMQKFKFGGYIEVKRQDVFSIDVSPTIAYALTGKLDIGIGYNTRFTIKESKVSRSQFAYRGFVDYLLPGSLFLHLEYEDLRPLEPDAMGGNNSGDLEDQYIGHYIGLGKRIKISDKMNSNVMILYNLKYKQGGPQNSPISFRFGADL